MTFVGEIGHALLLKLAINISLAVQMLAFSEGVLLAEQGGVDRAVALQVMTHSAIGSPMLQARAALLHELPDNAWFDVAMMQKDVQLALDSGRDERPGDAVDDRCRPNARHRPRAGYEHRDIAVLFRVLSDLVTAPPGEPVGSAIV